MPFPLEGSAASQPRQEDLYDRVEFRRQNDGDRYNRMCKDKDAFRSSTQIATHAGTGFDYRVHFRDGGGKDISPWHEIPLVKTPKTSTAPPSYNFICEIPRK